MLPSENPISSAAVSETLTVGTIIIKALGAIAVPIATTFDLILKLVTLRFAQEPVFFARAGGWIFRAVKRSVIFEALFRSTKL